MGYSQDMVKGSIVPVVLALLRDRPMYGYEMVRRVDARTNGRLRWREGTLYPTLHKLEADGLVKAQWQDAATDAGGTRQRKYYRLTRAGRSELARRTAEWADFADAVNAAIDGGTP